MVPLVAEPRLLVAPTPVATNTIAPVELVPTFTWFAVKLNQLAASVPGAAPEF